MGCAGKDTEVIEFHEGSFFFLVILNSIVSCGCRTKAMYIYVLYELSGGVLYITVSTHTDIVRETITSRHTPWPSTIGTRKMPNIHVYHNVAAKKAPREQPEAFQERLFDLSALQAVRSHYSQDLELEGLGKFRPLPTVQATPS